MACYQPYLSLSITHSYLRLPDCPDGGNAAVVVVPTTETQRWLMQNQMRSRATHNGVDIFCDNDFLRTTPPPNNEITLEFKLFSPDPYFRNYTHMPLPLSVAAAQFTVVINDEEKQNAIADLWLSPEQIQKSFSPTVISADDLNKNLIGLVTVAIPAQHYHKANNHITLIYQHYEAFWQYYFLSLKPSDALIITESSNRYAFEYQGLVSLNKPNVMTFVSQTPIPVFQRSPLSFSLKNQHRIIYKRLPVADPKHIEVITQHGKHHRLCHIFVD